MASSNNSNDVLECFNHGVAGYIVKPVDYKKFVEAIRTIDLYWTLSELPDCEGGVKHEESETVTTGRG